MSQCQTKQHPSSGQNSSSNLEETSSSERHLLVISYSNNSEVIQPQSNSLRRNTQTRSQIARFLSFTKRCFRTSDMQIMRSRITATQLRADQKLARTTMLSTCSLRRQSSCSRSSPSRVLNFSTSWDVYLEVSRRTNSRT